MTVFYGFLLGWCLTLGVLECLRFDLGGEFESSFSELAEQIGRRLLPAASELHVNVPEERGSTSHDVWWTNFRSSGTILRQNCGCAVLNWSTNTAIGDSGHSPSQWVLDRSLRLPFQLLSRASQSASHQRHRDAEENVDFPVDASRAGEEDCPVPQARRTASLPSEG